MAALLAYYANCPYLKGTAYFLASKGLLSHGLPHIINENFDANICTQFLF